ncbi:hypothetical protein GOODEAATRI_004270 [Goodea atripinnis]|uniref:Uncharacterized protein n=1 Tax=Goodea atripinnis TaxID=208336 RepID=A0ABV0MYK8_9TELE
MGEPERAGPALSDTLLREKQHGADYWLWLLPLRSHAAHVPHTSCSSLPDAPAGFTAEQRRRGHDRPPHPGKVGRPPVHISHRTDHTHRLSPADRSLFKPSILFHYISKSLETRDMPGVNNPTTKENALRMSATDSDNSIDWLASDTEENESEQEPDCTAKHAQRELSPSESSSELKEGSWCEVSGSRGSPSYATRSERDSGNGLCKSQHGEKANGKNTQLTKRPHSSTGEQCKERQLISTALEKDQVFINKGSAVSRRVWLWTGFKGSWVFCRTPSLAGSSVSRIDPPTGTKALRVTDLTPPEAYSANNLKWLHTSPICSPTAEEAQAGPRHPLLPRDKDLTQDSAVSSSTDSHDKTDSVPRGPPSGKINAPCLERLLKSTDSIITRKGTGGLMGSSWS